MTITVQCSCGKTSNVDEQHRGKKAKCPACGNVMVVQEAAATSGTETAVQTEEPKRKATVPAEINNTSEMDKPIKRPAGSNRKLLLGLAAGGGCGVLALFCCLVGGAVAAWFYFSRGSAPDLNFVHAEVTGFMSFRVADIMKTPTVKDQLGLLPIDVKATMDKQLDAMEKKIGLRLDGIERMTIIFSGANSKDAAVLVRSGKALDQKKILDSLATEKTEKKHKNAVYFVINNTKGIHFVNDRTLLMTETETSLTNFLDEAGKKPTHQALTRGLELASAGNHQFVAAFKLSPPIVENAFNVGDRQDLGPNILRANGIVVTGILEYQLTLEITGTYADTDSAKLAKTDTDGFRTKVVQQFKGEPRRPNDPSQIIRQFLESMTVEQRSAEVVLKAKLDFNLRPFAPVVAKMTDLTRAAQVQSINNLKNIGLAMHSFHDANKSLPNHAILHQQTGLPLLSWRVAILPYLDEAPLYNQINKDEAWDSQHNRQFWSKMPKAYQLPGKPKDEKTYYQVFHGAGSAFPTSKRPGLSMGSGVTLVGITDGISNTIFVAEAANGVNWMKPEDIDFKVSPNGFPLDRLGNHWGNDAFLASMGDATVRRFPRSLTPVQMQGFITANGGEIVTLPDVD